MKNKKLTFFTNRFFVMFCNKCFCELSNSSDCDGSDVYITICSHVFCSSCARSCFTSSSSLSCPICHTPLSLPQDSSPGDIAKSQCPAFSSDCSDEKALVPLVLQHLCGLDPTLLFFAAEKASEFWLYQQRVSEGRSATTRDEAMHKTTEELRTAKTEIAELRGALEAEQRKTELAVAECREQQRRAEELKGQVVELTQQKTKLAALYGAMKAQHTSPGQVGNKENGLFGKERKRPEFTGFVRQASERERGVTSSFFGVRKIKGIESQPAEKKRKEEKGSVLTKWDKILDFGATSVKKEKK